MAREAKCQIEVYARPGLKLLSRLLSRISSFVLPSPYAWLGAKGHKHFPRLQFHQAAQYLTPACTVLLQMYLAQAAKWCCLVRCSFLSLKSPIRIRCVLKLFSSENGLFVAVKTTFPTFLGWWAGVNCRLLCESFVLVWKQKWSNQAGNNVPLFMKPALF